MYLCFVEIELIIIKIGFLRIFKVTLKLGQSPCTGYFAKNEMKKIVYSYKFF